jgi:hypothetical protein
VSVIYFALGVVFLVFLLLVLDAVVTHRAAR